MAKKGTSATSAEAMRLILTQFEDKTAVGELTVIGKKYKYLVKHYSLEAVECFSMTSSTNNKFYTVMLFDTVGGYVGFSFYGPHGKWINTSVKMFDSRSKGMDWVVERRVSRLNKGYKCGIQRGQTEKDKFEDIFHKMLEFYFNMIQYGSYHSIEMEILGIPNLKRAFDDLFVYTDVTGNDMVNLNKYAKGCFTGK